MQTNEYKLKHLESKLEQYKKDNFRLKCEIEALRNSAKEVLENKPFKNSARAIFDYCKDLIGAKSGYVALLNEQGDENELLFLESGGLSCKVDPSLPMPIRGFRANAYASGLSVYDNHFMQSQCVKYLPEGHLTLQNVLFAPLNLEGKTVGLIGLANKPSDFTDNDAMLASSFGEIAAIALKNSKATEEREKAEAKIKFMAMHDPLTHLPNRYLLFDRIEQNIVQADRNQEQFAVLYIDLDGFKKVNDTLGHNAGDLVLKETAIRIQKCLRKIDTVARIGGDEFIVVLPRIRLENEVKQVIDRIKSNLKKPIDLNGKQRLIEASFGYSIYPKDGSKDIETIINKADKSMYVAKSSKNQ